jgi:hypothetical protein
VRTRSPVQHRESGATAHGPAGPGGPYARGVQLVAEGRLAEVYALDNGRVVKLDRPEWSGVSEYESDVLVRLAAADLPIARSHGVVTIDGRCGVVLDHIDGRPLHQVVVDAPDDELDGLAERFSSLQAGVNETAVGGLPDLVARLHGELAASGLPVGTIDELARLLDDLDDGRRGVCHFDFHLDNVLVTSDRWVVIDWVTVASGPPAADLARTLLLRARIGSGPIFEFMQAFRRHSRARRSLDEATVDAWIRVAAGARLAEGFYGADAAWLREVAAGTRRIPA